MQPVHYEFDDKPHEECGLFGIYSHEKDAVFKTYVGMHALQHRGQTGAGMAVFNGDELHVEKDNGEVEKAMTDERLRTLAFQATSPAIIGHDRYSTSGKTDAKENARLAQPFGAASGNFALGHNGNIENISRFAARLGIDISGCESDSESLTCMLDEISEQRGDLIEALHIVLPKIEGSYSLVLNQPDRLIGVRDPWGFRPLSIGKRGSEYVLASETVALDMVDATLVWDVEPGEIVIIDEQGIRSERLGRQEDERFCYFEYIYFAHPNSLLHGKNVYQMRERLGRALGAHHPVDADIVVGVQNSGAPYARGYAHQTGIQEVLALTKNPYITRTFIQDNQLTRDQSVKLKHQPNRFLIEGNRVVLVDDSIVRGTTMRVLVDLLRKNGAREVHVRIPSPPYASPCFWGMDTKKPAELIGHGKTPEEIQSLIGADSLEFLELDHVLEVLDNGFARRNKTASRMGPFCVSCATGESPIQFRPRLLQ